MKWVLKEVSLNVKKGVVRPFLRYGVLTLHTN